MLVDEFLPLAGADMLNMTRLAMNVSECVNGVAASHAKTAEALFPGYHVRAITNGVHPYTWTCPELAQVVISSRVAELGCRHELVAGERFRDLVLGGAPTVVPAVPRRDTRRSEILRR